VQRIASERESKREKAYERRAAAGEPSPLVYGDAGTLVLVIMLDEDPEEEADDDDVVDVEGGDGSLCTKVCIAWTENYLVSNDISMDHDDR